MLLEEGLPGMKAICGKIKSIDWAGGGINSVFNGNGWGLRAKFKLILPFTKLGILEASRSI